MHFMITERVQKTIWKEEHRSSHTLPALAAEDPSGMVVAFVNYFKEQGSALPQSVIDIGCGKGRNALYLAMQGARVWGIDYIEDAVMCARKRALELSVDERINFVVGEIDAPWPFADNFFDSAIDCFSSIDIETLHGRRVCRDEMFRTLKSRGYALVCVVAAHDAWEKELIVTNPGEEPNSSFWPINGKFQKNYDAAELRTFYAAFEIVELREVSKKAVKLGKEFIATNFWLLLRKP
jgi:ubiquinone/menaquinone biosynthesis C-methylase UbiE